MSETRSFSALLHDWLAAYEAFFALLAIFPAEDRDTPGLCGTWSARQVVAHCLGSSKGSWSMVWTVELWGAVLTSSGSV